MHDLPSYRPSRIPPHAQKVFSGVLFDIYQWEQELYDGSTATFELAHQADGAVVIPVLPDGTILLVDEEQPGRSASINVPMGRVEKGETPEAGALRELKEETGLEPEALLPFFSFEQGGKIDSVVYVYVAKNCKKISEPQPEAGERIVPHPVTVHEFITLAADLSSPFRSRGLQMKVLEALNNEEKMKDLRSFLGS